jgi:hypothetical protein
MSKAIRSYPQSERRVIIARRLQSKSSGLGYWAAVDAQKHQGEVKKVSLVEEHSHEGDVTDILDNTLDSE